jgi:hypothetical protein
MPESMNPYALTFVRDSEFIQNRMEDFLHHPATVINFKWEQLQTPPNAPVLTLDVRLVVAAHPYLELRIVCEKFLMQKPNRDGFTTRDVLDQGLVEAFAILRL